MKTDHLADLVVDRGRRWGLVIRMKFKSGTGKRVVISEGEGGISRWY